MVAIRGENANRQLTQYAYPAYVIDARPANLFAGLFSHFAQASLDCIGRKALQYRQRK